jgi:hypothetical protein
MVNNLNDLNQPIGKANTEDTYHHKFHQFAFHDLVLI